MTKRSKVPKPKKQKMPQFATFIFKTIKNIDFKALPPRSSKQWILFLFLIALFTTIFFVLLKDLPSPTKLKSQSFPVSTQILDRTGQLLYEIYADRNRTPIDIDDLPDHVMQATIAIEDQNFYQHFGFSIQGITRALGNTLFKQRLQGGSTITQQLIKTALLTPERTLKRKLREAFLTLLTETLYTKKDILEMYLNHIPYGGTSWGIEAAAKTYFGKSTKDLDLSEAALLAGLPQAPTRYSPFTNPDASKARQSEVLRRMVEDGYINQDQADQAANQKLEFSPPSTDIKAPHFVFYVKDLLVEKYGLQTIERGGLRVTTTLDLDLHLTAQASLSAEIDRLETYRVGNGAALITKPNTGEILAMIGSRDYFDTEHDGQVNVTTRPRQPGSSIKPINYVTAFQNQKLTPASVLLDIPTCFRVTGQPLYCPKNYDYTHHGPVQVRYALGNSYNIPAVKTLALNGVEDMIATASAMGITTFTDPNRYGLSLTLGGGEIKMVDMATAFGTLANQGVKVPLQPILKIQNYRSEVLEEYNPQETIDSLDFFFNESHPESNTLKHNQNGLIRALNREPAYLVSHILQDNTARIAAFGGNSELVIRDQIVSAKTGTTNDLRDNWTIGYTPEFLTTVWVGNNDNTPMNPYLVSGVTGAAPIWHNIMSYVLINQEVIIPPKPAGIKQVNVCSATGGIPTEEQPCTTRQDFAWSKFLPKNTPAVKRGIWAYKDSGIPAFPNQQIPEDLNTDNLELREHLIISDPFTKEFCLDCPWPTETNEDGSPKENGKTQYPITNVDMSTFNPFGPEKETPPQQTQ